MCHYWNWLPCSLPSGLRSRILNLYFWIDGGVSGDAFVVAFAAAVVASVTDT